MSASASAAPFLGWENYPSNLSDDALLGFNAHDYDRRFKELSNTLFSDRISVGAVEGHYESGKIQSVLRTLQDRESLQDYLQRSHRPILRILNIHQEHSLSPFSISEECMRKILTHFAITPRFLDLLFGVSNRTKVAEEAYGAAVYSGRAADKTELEISYQFKYAETNVHAQGSRWSFRQMEVYNRFGKSTSDGTTTSLWLIMTPMPDSTVQQRIEKLATSDDLSPMVKGPLRLHLVLLSTHLDNWREYLDDEGQSYQEQRKYILATDFDDEDDFNRSINFDALQNLRSLQERLLSLPVVLGATIATIKALMRMNEDTLLDQMHTEAERTAVAAGLQSLQTRAMAHLRSAEMLQERIVGVEKLIADGLSLRNQVIAATNQKIAADNQKVATTISEKLYKLQQDSVDDSAYVQLVSLATLIYLPGSFVASLFGMNFFAFSGAAQIEIASDVWIYIVLTIPVTAVTIAGWYFASQKQKEKNKTNREHMESLSTSKP